MTGEGKRGQEIQVIWDAHSSPRKVTFKYLDFEAQSLMLLLNTFARSYLNTAIATSTFER